MLPDRARDDQLVRLRLLDERLQPRPHRLRRADERARQHRRGPHLLLGRPVRLDVVDRRRQLPAPAAVDVRERLLHRGEQPARLLVRVGGDHVRGDHRPGPLELLRRLEPLAVDSSAGSSASGAKCDANAYGSPSSAASCAPYRLEPRIQSGTFVPAPGVATTGCPSLRIVEPALQLEHVLRERVLGRRGRAAAPRSSADRCPARGRGRGRCGRDGARRASRTAPRSRAARGSGA